MMRSLPPQDGRSALGLTNPGAEVFVPDGSPLNPALSRITEVGVGAHPDDLEIMAFPGILRCFADPAQWFLGVMVTNGGTEQGTIRKTEQMAAARTGKYGALIWLDYTSAAVKNPTRTDLGRDLRRIFGAITGQRVFTHNLADSHDTHVAVALHTLAALRDLPTDKRPQQILGGEVWRTLDWLAGIDRVMCDVTAGVGLAEQLLREFRSQLTRGKPYDLATVGRWRANATFTDPYHADAARAVALALDLTPLVEAESFDPIAWISDPLARLHADVTTRVQRLDPTRARRAKPMPPRERGGP